MSQPQELSQRQQEQLNSYRSQRLATIGETVARGSSDHREVTLAIKGLDGTMRRVSWQEPDDRRDVLYEEIDYASGNLLEQEHNASNSR